MALSEEKSSGKALFSSPLFKRVVGGSVFGETAYDLMLGRKQATGMAVTPTDPWPADAEKGREILGGVYRFGAASIEEKMNWDWLPDKAPESWIKRLHRFEWVRDLRAVGGDRARYKARTLIAHWLDHHGKFNKTTWQADLVARRLLSWLGLFGFYGASADFDFQMRLFEACLKQGRHLEKIFEKDCIGFEKLTALKALFFLSVCLPECGLEPQLVLSRFENEAAGQIFQDGIHQSRNPEIQIELLRHLIDLRALTGQLPYKLEHQLGDMIAQVAGGVRFFRYQDGGFALFGGGGASSSLLIDTLLNHASVRGKSMAYAEFAGFRMVRSGRTDIMIDTGMETSFERFSPHLSLAAFELCHAKQRIITNCGGFVDEPKWHDALRQTAAHSTLAIEGLRAESLGDINFSSDENGNSILVELDHDAWVRSCGARHIRRLYIADQGEDLRGEDRLTGCAHDGLKVTIRFHLHPDVKASLIQSGHEILLNAGKNNGWRFAVEGAEISLENSIYMADTERQRRTKQIVLTSQTVKANADENSCVVRWALQKESL